MPPSRMMLLVFAIAATGADVRAQTSSSGHPTGQMGQMPMHGMMMAHGATHGATIPHEPGQAAFGAIQEIVEKLQADPQTDWSKVDVDALRQHLIDMDEVTIRAVAQKEPVENGLSIKVTGQGRTLTAIQRMVPAQVREIDGQHGWTARTVALPDGVELTVTAKDPAEVQKIRALGFMGIMVQGSHHQMHHLGMSQGEPPHMH